jgi:uncharacterized protein YggT (Ycf19 family)
VDYLFMLLYGVLAIRLVLALLAARQSNGFVQMIDSVTDPFYAPFRGIVSSPSAEGGFTLVVPIIIAILAYALLHAAIRGCSACSCTARPRSDASSEGPGCNEGTAVSHRATEPRKEKNGKNRLFSLWPLWLCVKSCE